jgi:hypothetical protein
MLGLHEGTLGHTLMHFKNEVHFKNEDLLTKAREMATACNASTR